MGWRESGLRRGVPLKAKMGLLARVNPYYKGVKEESSLFFTVVCVNVFSYHTDVIFSYFKASDQSFLLNGNLYLLKITVKHQFYNSSFIRFIHSFFLFSSCSAMASNCLRRRKTRVLFRPYLDTDVSTVCSTGLSLIRGQCFRAYNPLPFITF